LKLLIVYETVYPDFIGGVEHRNYELAVALCRRGHEVTLAGFCGALVSTVENLRILSLGELGGLYNRAGKRSTRKALRFAAAMRGLDVAPYDVVETPNMPYVHLLPLAWKCFAAGKPLLVTWYEYWGGYWRGYVGRFRAPAYRAVEWLTSQLGTAVTATSDLTRGRLAAARWRARRGRPPGESRGREPDGRTAWEGGAGTPAAATDPAAVEPAAADLAAAVDVVPCGIAASRVLTAAGDRPGDGPPLIYAGRLLEHKRLDLVLRAVQRLAQSDGGGGAGRPLLTVFGEGPDRERLEALARELGVAGRVLFRGHVQSSEEVWRELGRARLAVQPSAREGFGLFPLEAMAAGLPVVFCASPESAVGELVRDGVEGVAVAPDAAALAAALAALLAPAAAAEWQRLSRNALARAAAYDWQEIAARIEGVCLDLIARRRR
jgi:glycosyltransferase involved in cell wall biosynthesis